MQYYEEIGKPTPKVEVMKFLKGKQYADAKNFTGECESVVVVAKGQGKGNAFDEMHIFLVGIDSLRLLLLKS